MKDNGVNEDNEVNESQGKTEPITTTKKLLVQKENETQRPQRFHKN